MTPNEKLQESGKRQLLEYISVLSDDLIKGALPEIVARQIFLINTAGFLYCPHELSKLAALHLHFMMAYVNNLCSQCGGRFNVANLKLTTHGCLCVSCHNTANQPQQKSKE